MPLRISVRTAVSLKPSSLAAASKLTCSWVVPSRSRACAGSCRPDAHSSSCPGRSDIPTGSVPAAMARSSLTLANSVTKAITSWPAARRCCPGRLWGTRISVCTPPIQCSWSRCSAAASTSHTTISCSTVRRISFFNSTLAFGLSQSRGRSSPSSLSRCFCSTLSVLAID